ncbi:Homolog of E. coli HemX protein [plant metagenome]|uniref:Homolog of E. coli HemX protein n=1 Tax=plant metagenome TaxID=1297885 RepID=A0A484QB34_9ZZZZ
MDGRNDYNRDMTDKTPDTTPGAKPSVPSPTPASTAPVPPSPPPAAPASPPAGKKPAPVRKSSSGLVFMLLILGVLVVAMAAALWYQRQQSERTTREIAARLDTLTSQLNQARNDARQAITLAQTQGSRLAGLETAVQDAQTQFDSLEQTWQSFSDSSAGDAVLLNDVERMLALASQQLRLAGNVSNAIVAMETVQARLARADRPRLASLQQAVNGDLDRLRAVPLVDVPAVSGRIDRLIDLVGRAPLLVPDAAAPEVTSAPISSREPGPPVAGRSEPDIAADAPWWQRTRAEMGLWWGQALRTLGGEFGDLISIQRVGNPDALLLSPDQGAQLRGNLRMRLLTAQLSLLMRQSDVWTSELDTVERALAGQFDTHSADTQQAQRLARELAATRIAVSVPDLADSLSALEAVRAAGNGAARGE